MSKVYFSIGSNKGNRSGLINEAIDKIDIAIGRVELKSNIYETKSWGFNSNNFYNICLLIESSISPDLILNKILIIEKEMGRLKTGDQYNDRCVDIDILFVDDIIVNSKNLIIPHPRIQLRKFVLTPMLDLAPDLIHPILNKSIRQLDLECDDNDQPIKID
ncbi:MAG: 2-amino-4-hydroxy-6-hydroxymethyldihydropteridine diphosphokinase [Cryomorphaceae bacterium]|jgi:2-amino-4-hydroxy-6-hydroxymethyldihydropteridine diphosphokinase|nr:2-amino-4-hydroxy-6-hydroxymethyldihydropteridine diphosphokinase [Cryomorphaceae bacterium]MBT3503032.1 2-amino-4-hydroxy-6-hydroxymethyldihydropteridine diphosphokinase [Cryomorphaceae bacterium]MBT3689198.1 2-amino-4-hydroxy-6-hydroxymethyldihydropteridine diphosphokinase [Cryomorphaceae bacterium]MBT4222119.1 2-amino-4-hydroxy-6-hydroxymethyldihydropteridine diphosphokinase [Cryomorphaceae bacterium]MBT4293254.1 2-amino-4-hydroxy-6-hydroxymethyldihydropteridine diphosphokinase [Cryomorph